MATKLVMPKLGLSMTEAKILEWLKNEGEIMLYCLDNRNYNW